MKRRGKLSWLVIAAALASLVVGLSAGMASADDSISPDTEGTPDQGKQAVDQTIGKEWSGQGFSGALLIASGLYDCTDSFGYNIHDLGTQKPAWQNRISSSKGFNGCNRVRHFQYAEYNGDLKVCDPNCSTLGDMNDRTTSLKWRHG
jgi:hypothetical protein